MSLWGHLVPIINLQGFKKEADTLPLIYKRNFQLSTTSLIIKNSFPPIFQDKDICKLIEIFIGILDGDGYFDIGSQKQYNKDPNNKPKSTIRIRLGINLQYKDKELLEILVNKLGVGKIDYSKLKNQYRLILYKKDILNIIYPYLMYNKIEFLIIKDLMI